jgi:hypothetical protein
LLEHAAMEREPMAYSLRMTYVLVAAACVLAPMAAAAQQLAPRSDAMANPSQHLADGTRTLDSIPNSVQADAAKPLAELRRHFAELASTYRAHSDQIGPAIMRQDPAANEPPNWRDSFSAAERDLTRLIGGGPSLEAFIVSGAHVVVSAVAADANVAAPKDESVSAPAGGPVSTDSPVGTAGVGVSAPMLMPGTGTPAGPTDASAARNPAATAAGTSMSVAGVKDLDPTLRQELNRIRLDLELFYASTMGDRAGDPAGSQAPAR